MNTNRLTTSAADVKDFFAGHYWDFYGQHLELKEKRGDEAKAVCPFHADGDPSLSVNNETGQFHCFGCKESGDMFKFYGKLKGSASFPDIIVGIAQDFNILASGNGKISQNKPKPRRQQKKRGKIDVAYDYHDAQGSPFFQVVRFEPKDFRQRQPDGNGGWIWNLKGINPVLYHLPEIIKNRGAVFVGEGEKDVDRIRKDFKLCATTCPMGAEKWRDSYNETLRGKDVVLLPDNDEAGRKHVEKVAQSLHGIAKSIRVLDFPGLPEKGDVSDWIDAGGTKEEFQKLADECPPWEPEESPSDAIRKQFPRGPFPWDVLPSRIAESLQQLARSCATSATSLPGAALAVFASIIGCRIDVSPKQSWREPLILWFCDVRPSGAGKTPAARALCQVLYEAQDRADKDYQAEYDEWKALPKKERDARNEPARPRGYFTTSLTIEGIHAEHVGHGGKVCILDELSSFISSQNQYKSKGNDREAWLCLHDGKPARIVRVKESRTIRGARISIFGGIQPAIWIASFSGDEGQLFRVDGTIFRFLPTYEGAGFHPLTLESWNDENRNEWESTLRTAMRWADSQDSNKVLCLDSEAQQVFLDWRNDLYQIIEDLPEAVRGFVPKLVGYSLRFAGVLYLMDVLNRGNEPGAILNVADMEKGIKVSEFYAGHILEAMAALVSENAEVPFEKTDQVIHLAKTLEGLRKDLDGDLLAVGYVFERFNENAPKELTVKSEKAMGSILRRCKLTVVKKKHWKDRHGVNCLKWDEKTELLTKESPQSPQSPQREENQEVVSEDIEKSKSSKSSRNKPDKESVRTLRTLKNQSPQTKPIDNTTNEDIEDIEDVVSNENENQELDWSF